MRTLKETFLFLAVAGVALSLACTEKSPTGPSAVALSTTSLDERAPADGLSRPAPRLVSPRTPVGPPIRVLRIGEWGSAQSSGLDNRLLNVTSTGATLRSECTNGLIEGVIALNAAGQFDVLGTYQIQAGPVGLPRSARYVGRVIRDTLTLSVMLTDDNQTFGPFTLTFGQVPQIRYCPIV